MNVITPLLPTRWRPYAKAYLAAAFVVLSALAEVYVDYTPLTVTVSVLGALGVYAQPNPAAPGDGSHRAPSEGR